MKLLRTLLGCLVLIFGPAGSSPAAAQELMEDRAPRFLAMVPSREQPVEVDVSTVPVLTRRVALRLDAPTVGTALDAITRQTGIRFAYSARVLPLDRPVALRAENITVAAALLEILIDTGTDVMLSAGNRLALVKRQTREPAAIQTGAIAGRVTDAATGQPLAGAELGVAGTRLAATSDDSGRYALRDVPAGERQVTARRIGYQPRTETVTVPDGGTVTLDVALGGQPTRLDELVTTVTGDQRRLEVGNTVVSLDADSLIASAPVMSFGDLLQGRAPGVLSMTTTGGQTGQAGAIRIRGLNSARAGNDPIVVVDGIRIEATAGTKGGGNNATSPTAGGFSGRLSDLDPDEIASVEVVKGPSAATLYGTDAANGVVVITTKRGRPGRTRWTGFTEQGLVEQRLDYEDTFRDAYYAFGRSTTTDEPQRCTLVQRAAGSCVVDSLGTFNTFEHPDTRPFEDGYRQQYGLQASGGTAGGATYFLSGDYEQETGTASMPLADRSFLLAQRGVSELPDWQLRPNAYERVNLRANLTAPLGRRGSATLATGFVSNQARNTGSPLYRQFGYRDPANGGWADFSRPAFTYAMRSEDVVRRFIGSLATTYSAAEWLMLRGTVGADLSANAFGTLVRRGEDDPNGFATGWRDANELSVARYSVDLGATATKALSPSLSSKTSVGLQYNRRSQRGSRVIASDLPLGGETVAGGTVQLTQEATLATAVAGGYVEEVLGFRDRLFLTGALRFDGGSSFGRDFSVAAYPKASLSWVVSDGQAGPRLPGVSALRVRAAYGASGVQPGPTDALALLAVSSGLSVDGTAPAPGAALQTAGNVDLKPERTREVEAGVDLDLWASRVRLEFTAYQRTSSDALFVLPNGADIGGSQIVNLGSVRNRGLELWLSADLLRGRTLAAGLTATGALNQNRLRRLGAGVVARNPLGEGASAGLLEEGYPIFGLWGFQLESFADANGNGIIEPGEITLSEASRFVGSNFPTREATVAPYVKLFGERLHLTGSLQYRGGFSITNSPVSEACQDAVRSCREVNDITAPLADQAKAVARASFGRRGPHMENGSYLLLRELSLGLTVPAGVTRALGAREGRLVLAGRNLAMLWKASDVPVEIKREAGLDSEISGVQPNPSTYWLLRVHLNY